MSESEYDEHDQDENTAHLPEEDTPRPAHNPLTDPERFGWFDATQPYGRDPYNGACFED